MSRLNRSKLTVALATTVLTVAASGPAQGYSVGVHMRLANDVRERLGTDGRNIVLLGPSGAYVAIRADRAAAILANPTYWRGGAIGPDNTIATALTDPSHTWFYPYQPFQQCQLLVDAATNDQELAYALGCFLHGATDNVAHHFVNHFTGETFTLTPVAANMQYDLENVVRHIVVEETLQDGFRTLWPQGFEPVEMEHDIALSLYQRVYLDTNAPFWLGVTQQARASHDALVPAFSDPSVTAVQWLNAYLTWLSGEAVDAPHALFLMPLIIQDARSIVDYLPLYAQNTIDYYCSGVDPDVTVDLGPDGACGTRDDESSCSWWWCPVKNTEYFWAVWMMTEEDLTCECMAAGQVPMQLLVDLKHEALDAVIPGYVQSIENLSNRAARDGVGGINSTTLGADFAPFTDAVSEAADTSTMWKILVPTWLLDYRAYVEQALTDLVQAVVESIQRALMDYLYSLLEQYLGDLVAQYYALRDTIRAEIEAELQRLVPSSVGDFASQIDRSVMYLNSVNAAAGAIASPEMFADSRSGMAIGPHSFDASYQLRYNGLYQCDNLRDVFFPYGVSVSDALSLIDTDGNLEPAMAGIDPPVECHDGQIAFAASPTIASCEPVLATLLQPSLVGSTSWAFPPELSRTDRTPSCNTVVQVPVATGDPTRVGGTISGGCGCVAAGPNATNGASNGLVGLMVIALGAFAWHSKARRRRR